MIVDNKRNRWLRIPFRMRPANTSVGGKRASGMTIQVERIHRTGYLRKQGPRGGKRKKVQEQRLILNRRKKILLPLR